MTMDLFTATGTKKGTLTLPESLFGAAVLHDLMHQALVAQQSNRRVPLAHVKRRGEVEGSTRKLYAQKGTGRARRGPIRSPLLRGGGKAFGPRSNANFLKRMPKFMRRRAVVSCLSYRAREQGVFLGLESYGDSVKTKDAAALLRTLPVELGRPILIVTAAPQRNLVLATRNIPGTKTISAAYLNPEDLLSAHRIIFFADALKVAEDIFTKRPNRTGKRPSDSAESPVSSGSRAAAVSQTKKRKERAGARKRSVSPSS